MHANQSENICGWVNGVHFPPPAGHWVSGKYRRPDGGVSYCQYFDMGDMATPSLMTRLRMRLQGWSWEPRVKGS